MNRAGSVLFNGELLSVEDWYKHPEMNCVRAWFRRRGLEAEFELEVIRLLAQHVRMEWEYTPQRSTAQHKALYRKIERLSKELRAALSSTGVEYKVGRRVEGLQVVSLGDLLSEWHGQEASSRGELRHLTIDSILTWLQAEAARIHERTTLHPRPQRTGSRRGFFVRRMNQILTMRYRRVPRSALASITSVALDEITDEAMVVGLLR